MKLTVVLIFVVACFWCCEAQNGASYYCGRRLSQVLAALCWGAEEKRSASWWGPEERRPGGWWARGDAARALGGVRGKRGLADECCDKPCTVDELLTYC
ncbi:hypothetical protein PYW07_015042 [Mythimna separata]|uniref:Insulin-like domain-containing protein n=1 Tax=Mythimna separata TaxID=271217 RepID=A0AAD7YY16_MYTSE|nr:hypothetical protein PYW07_015042 [Mythimna separata]